MKKDITPDIQMPEIKIIRYLDKMAVRRVFDNILSNAARYADGNFTVKLTAEGKILFSNYAANLSRVEVERFFTSTNGKRIYWYWIVYCKGINRENGWKY